MCGVCLIRGRVLEKLPPRSASARRPCASGWRGSRPKVRRAPSSVVKWCQRHRMTGGVAPGQMGGHRPAKIIGDAAAWLRRRLSGSDFTLRGLVSELAGQGLKVDYRTVWSFVHREGLSFKKGVLASEQDRPDVSRRRTRWKACQGRVDPARLVFIDETWAKTTMAPLRGWAPRGERLKAKAPFGLLNTMTFLAALRGARIEAPGSRRPGYSTARSMAKPSRPMSSRCRPPRFIRAAWPSWATSAATRPPLFVPPAALPGQSSSSCRPTAPI